MDSECVEIDLLWLHNVFDKIPQIHTYLSITFVEISININMKKILNVI